MTFGAHLFLLKRRIVGVMRRVMTRLRRPTLTRVESDSPPDLPKKIVWCTQVVAGREEELKCARGNLERLRPVLAWAGLTVDGSTAHLETFATGLQCEGYDNIVWLSQPEVVSRSGYGEAQGHMNRHNLNFLRGWICNLDPGDEAPAELFCHSDGDWEIQIRPESIEPLTRFFHQRPEVVAITRNLDWFLKDEPGMWPDPETDGALWYGNGMLSTNLIISPIDRFRPLVLQAWNVFPGARHILLEEVLGRLVAQNGQLVAYPRRSYFQEHFFIDLAEKRQPFDASGST